VVVKSFLFSLLVWLCISCQTSSPVEEEENIESSGVWVPREIFRLESIPDQHLTELKPCDILVKPNLNYIPGTTFVEGMFLFGHASIVIKGNSDTNETALLAKVITFESNARDIPGEYQLRQVAAYVPGNDYCFANYNFSPEKLGNLYRLRMDLTDAQRDSIIAFVLEQDDDLSHYRASKRFSPYTDSLRKSPLSGGKLEYWYCSLLIWQAFYDVLGIDLDANKGFYVHPNDLINSPYFNDEPGKHEKRVRF
jgi:hypothetical protein